MYKIITAPAKGVENIRKPILHEINLKTNLNETQESIKNEAENFKSIKEIPSIRQFTSKRNSQISKKSSGSIVFDTRTKEEPPVFQEFDELNVELQKKINRQDRSIKNTEESNESPIRQEKYTENSNKTQKTAENISKRSLELIIKFQAHIRGYLAREKYKLLKKKSKILYRGAKRIQGILSMITILLKEKKIYAVINDDKEDQMIHISENIPPNEIVKRLEKNDKGFSLSNIEKDEKNELIKSIRIKIDKEDCEVKYFFDSNTNTLLIRATKYSNSRVYTTEKNNMSFNSRPLLIRYIHDEIQPHLMFFDQKLIISKEKEIIEREFLAKGTRIMQKKEFTITANKVVSEEGLCIEYISENSSKSIKNIFSMTLVLDCLSIFNVEKIENDPHLALLPLQYQDQTLILKKLDKKYVECVVSDKKILNNSQYLIKIFKIQDDIVTYFIEAFNINSPPVLSFSITDKNLSSIYSYKPLQLLKQVRYYNGAITLSDVSRTSSPADLVSLPEERVIYRTCKNVSSKLYQITLSILNTEEGNEMIFSLRQNSLTNISKVFKINEKVACEKTGFSKEYIIPMGDYMIRNMLIINDDNITLDETKPPFDFKKARMKIQAILKGHLIRTKLKDKIKMQLMIKCKFRMDNDNVTALVYKKNEDIALYVVKEFEVFSILLDKRIIEDQQAHLEKFLQSKLLPKLAFKLKNNKKILTGIKDYKKSLHQKDSTHKVPESLHLQSLLSPKTLKAAFSPNSQEPDDNKNLKWRSMRIIGIEKCLVSIYEIGNKGLIEADVISQGKTLTLEVTLEQINKPDSLVNQLDLSKGILILKNASPNIVYSDKRYISNKFVELSIFVTEKGYFANAYLPEENKSLNSYLGNEVKPEDVSRYLKIEEVMGQDVLLVSR